MCPACLQVGTTEPRRWRNPSVQKSMQGKFPSRCLRTYSHCDLPITGEGGSRVVATTEEPLERSTGEHYCLLMVLVLLAAISLQTCCIAVSSGMRGFAKHQNFETGTHMQGEIDHFSQFVCSQCTGPNALVTLVQGGKYTQSLTAQQTVFEVSPVMNMGGNVPLVFCVWNGVWRLATWWKSLTLPTSLKSVSDRVFEWCERAELINSNLPPHMRCDPDNMLV